MNTDSQCGALVLAAGRGRRFGSDKRRARLPDGRALLRATLDIYLPNVDALRLVLGPDDDISELLAGSMDLADCVVRAADADMGMGHSLAAGIAACTAWDAALVVLADMAWIRPATVTAIVAAWRRSTLPDTAIVRPRHQGRSGHPVCFGAAHFEALAACRGDRGAADLLRTCPTLHLLDVDDPGVLIDADTPEALRAASTGQPA